MNTIILESVDDYLDWIQFQDMVEIVNIRVSKRREGRGARLVNLLVGRCQGWCRMIYAKTRTTNMIARQFYEGTGFSELGVLMHFYGQDQHAVVYGMKTS